MPCASASGSTGSAYNSPPHSPVSSLRLTVHSFVSLPCPRLRVGLHLGELLPSAILEVAYTLCRVHAILVQRSVLADTLTVQPGIRLPPLCVDRLSLGRVGVVRSL